MHTDVCVPVIELQHKNMHDHDMQSVSNTLHIIHSFLEQ
jgi:hypothetical protein